MPANWKRLVHPQHLPLLLLYINVYVVYNNSTIVSGPEPIPNPDLAEGMCSR